MLKVSDAFNSAFAAPDRELRARVTIGKTVYNSDDLTSINYDSGAMTGEQFSIGSTYMNSAKIIFSHLVEGLKQLDEVLVEFGVLKPDGTVEYVKMGTFIVDDKIQMDRNNNTTTIECMDRMTMLGGTYVSKLTYPARIKDVAIEIANMAGVKANETSFARLSENKINQPTGYTYRDAIGLIAQFQMGFALFDRDGLLDVRTLQDNSFKIDPNQYFLKGLVKNETFFKLNGISCTVVTTSKGENGNETSKTTVLQSGSSSGAQIKLANNVMTQDVLDRMYEALKFTNYYPFSLNWNGNPAVEAGDWLTVEDLQGNEFKVPNMSYTLTYNGGLTTTSKADTSVSSPATYSYGGSMSNIVNEIGGREGAEGNHIYEGTEDQKPLFPKEGDLWYKHVGPDTEEWIYKDGKWEFLTSTKTANDAADAADKASKEAEEAKKQANKAVDGANDAVAKAGFANDTATQAKSDAATAGQQAKDALTSAGTAITDAKKALTNSSSAQVDSAQARKDSATAIKDAADSLTSAKDAINKVGNLTTSVTSQFTTVNNELKSKVNQTDYDKLKGTVTSQQTEINQNASGIKLKADKSYADTINNSVVKNTSGIGLLNNQIALTVSKAELNNALSSYATQTWTQSQIKSTADSINLSVTKVQNNLDNLAIGGRNYILKSGTYTANMNTMTRMYLAESIGYFSEKSIALSCRIDFDNHVPGQKNRYGMETKLQGVDGKNYYASVWKNAVAGESFHGTIHALFNMPKLSPTNDLHEFWLYNQSATPNSTVTKPKIEIGTRATDWTEAPEDNATVETVSKIEVDLSGVKTTVANKADQSQITQLANQISLKADTTALNELKGTVDKQGSEITLNTNSIKLKADQSSVDTLKGTVDKQGSAIDVNTKAIDLKASQSTVDTLTGRVSTAEGKITVQADQIAQTVSKTELTTKLNDYATQTWTQGQIKTTADQINLSVSKVQTNLDNIQVGGANILRNGMFEFGSANWRNWEPNGPVSGDSRQYQTGVGGDWVTGTKGMIHLIRTTASNGHSYGIAQDAISVIPGVEYTISFEAATGTPFTLSLGDNNSGYPFIYVIVKPTGHKRWSYTFKTPSTAKKMNVYLGWGDGQTGTNWISRIMLVQGNKSLDWGPNPADYATEVQFSQLQVTVNGIQGTVQNKADKSQVTQLANQITSTVNNLGTQNFVYNPSFKNLSLSGWLNTNNWYVSDLNVSGYNGTYGAGVNLTNVGTAGKNSFMYMGSKHIPHTSVGDTFYFSAYIKIYGQTTAGSYFFVDFATHNDENGSDRIEYKDSNQVTIANGTDKWLKLSGSFKITKPHKYISLSLYFSAHGVSSAHVMFSRPMLSYVQDAPFSDQGVSASEITQLTDLINLRVQKGDVINQINISPESILIAGQKVHITGQTSIDKAVIKDAMIADIRADKITAGTLNAANVNVINLNANNITTGTLKGANLSMNLNTGEVVFQKGAIRSTNGNLNIDISKGTMAVINQYKSGFYFEDGKLVLNDGWLEGTSNQPKYGSLEYNANFFTVNGLAVKGTEGVTIGTPGYNPLAMFTSVNESGIAIDKKHLEIGSVGPTIISSGNRFFMNLLTQSPFIAVGTTADGSYMTTSDPGSRISLYAEYVHIKSAYSKTASGSANVIVAQDGALVRSTSASKYKTDIIRANATDYGDKLLNLPTATWTDIAETKRYRDDPVNQIKPTRNFGMIAEDLADAGLEMLVVRGTDGELEGINYDRIGPALIPVIAKLKNEVEILKRKLEEKTA
ncbi:gp58-like family protein [Latilactobacillus sakei]|uniref:gp58-like family protein n=1 Tax=Latilactobacillus sakei TaxID=1599 RepID=UPI00097589CE|nr:gp58-like family protein [Latilactobacillus sakei]